MNAMACQTSTTAQVLFAGRSGPARQTALAAVAGRCREAAYLGVLGLAVFTLWTGAPRWPAPGELYVEATPFAQRYMEQCRREARSDDHAAALGCLVDARPAGDLATAQPVPTR